MRGAGLPLGCKFFIGHKFPDHSQLTGLLGRDLIGKKRGAHGLGQSHLPRQKIGAARIGNETDTREGLHKIGRLRRNHDIRCERQVGPCPGGRTIDR